MVLIEEWITTDEDLWGVIDDFIWIPTDVAGGGQYVARKEAWRFVARKEPWRFVANKET